MRNGLTVSEIFVKKRLNLPLMENNISRDDLQCVIKFLEDEPILTASKNVRLFEEEWSRWLGVKHSVFVNSGASANILTMAALAQLVPGGEIIVPPLTWISDVVSVLLAGFTPVFVDIDPRTLAMDTDEILSAITPKTRAVFLTHILGFNGLNDKLLDSLKEKGIYLVEDACESHGATFRERKLGTFGYVSNFSFYYAHHMSTIEGGMVCTDSDEFYQIARMFRAHGMVRESTDDDLKSRYKAEHSDLRPEFIFAYPGFNFRSTEINAVIGRSQLPRLDDNNVARRRNFKKFLENLDSTKYFTDFEVEGSCNYAFILVIKEPDEAFRERVIQTLLECGVEFRRGTSGGGNQLRQPYLKKILGESDLAKFPNVEHIHFFGFYIGNFPTLSEERVGELCQLLNSIN